MDSTFSRAALPGPVVPPDGGIGGEDGGGARGAVGTVCDTSEVLTASSAALPAPIVVEELAERCLGNAEIAEMVLSKFEEQLPRDLAELESGLRAGDAGQVERTAHRLKGAAGTVAAQRLGELTGTIEASAKLQELERIAQQLAGVREEIGRCLGALPAVRRALRGK